MTSKQKNLAPLLAGTIIFAFAFWAKKQWQLQKYTYQKKVCLIFGGSRGLGLVMARQLGKEGALLMLTARDSKELNAAKQELEGKGYLVETQVCDVTDARQVKSVVNTCVTLFGKIDVLINNAGIIQVGPFESMTRRDYENSLNVHFWGPYNTTSAALPHLKKNDESRIINISSIGGKFSVPHLVPYSVGKFALAAFSQGITSELRKNKIAVTTVYPGLMRTGSPFNAEFKGQVEKEFSWFSTSSSIPLLTIDAQRAAKQILLAARLKKAEIVLTPQARFAAILNTLTPNAFSKILTFISKMLPGMEGEKAPLIRESRNGFESKPQNFPDTLLTLTTRAAKNNNELH